MIQAHHYAARPTLPTQTGQHWMEDANCIGVDPELFTAPGQTWAGHHGQEMQAKSYCAPCPVKDACLAWALATGDEFSILGGTTAKERRKMGATVSSRSPLVCPQNHDTSHPDARYLNGDCKKCRREKAAKRRAANQAKVTAMRSQEAS